MLAPRLLLPVLLAMAAGAAAGVVYRGGFFGGYSGMIAGLILGIMVAALLFMAETLVNRRHWLTPIVVAVVAAGATFFAVRVAYRPPASVIYGQAFGEPAESVENVRGTVRYAGEDHAILLRFDIAADDLQRLVDEHDLQPQPEDEPIAVNLEPFDLPPWWQLDPDEPGVAGYHRVVDYAGRRDQRNAEAPPVAEDHTPAHEYFARPGQLFYDRGSGTAYYFDRSYWRAAEADEADDAEQTGSP